MLEGKNVNLRILEREDMPLFVEWLNTPEVLGEFNPLRQVFRTEVEKTEKDSVVFSDFVIEKKDGGKVGFICHFDVVHPALGKHLEIGYSLVPSERGKGYGTEAVKVMVDYLFLSKDVMRVQACTDVRNMASQKVLEKAGFKKEGTMRKYLFIRGQLRDSIAYSILREEWKEPKILTRTA